MISDFLLFSPSHAIHITATLTRARAHILRRHKLHTVGLVNMTRSGYSGRKCQFFLLRLGGAKPSDLTCEDPVSSAVFFTNSASQIADGNCLGRISLFLFFFFTSWFFHLPSPSSRASMGTHNSRACVRAGTGSVYGSGARDLRARSHNFEFNGGDFR